ncbi:30S ribosomal protein S4 [Gemmatimonadota bacterium]
MARYTESVCKLCRRESMKLFLKGERCVSEKCAMERRSYPPGQHGPGMRRRKASDYSIQLREKQKVKRIYGVGEAQFRNYFAKATRAKGTTGEVLLTMLETRLDNVVYRLGFASSRPQARQIVRHRHVMVNSRTVDIPSYQVKAGDLVEVRERSRSLESIQDAMKRFGRRGEPSWLTLDKAKMAGQVVQAPTRSDVDLEINEQLIVELYSR